MNVTKELKARISREDVFSLERAVDSSRSADRDGNAQSSGALDDLLYSLRTCDETQLRALVIKSLDRQYFLRKLDVFVRLAGKLSISDAVVFYFSWMNNVERVIVNGDVKDARIGVSVLNSRGRNYIYVSLPSRMLDRVQSVIRALPDDYFRPIDSGDFCGERSDNNCGDRYIGGNYDDGEQDATSLASCVFEAAGGKDAYCRAIFILDLISLLEGRIRSDLLRLWPAYVTVAACLTGDRYAVGPFRVEYVSFAKG